MAVFLLVLVVEPSAVRSGQLDPATGRPTLLGPMALASLLADAAVILRDSVFLVGGGDSSGVIQQLHTSAAVDRWPKVGGSERGGRRKE